MGNNLFCGRCGKELSAGYKFCGQCGEGVTQSQEISPKNPPYRWGKTFSVIAAFFGIVGIAGGVFVFTYGFTLLGLGTVLMGCVLGAQAWGLFRKRRFGLYIFYFVCALILGQLAISYVDIGWNQAYLESKSEAWFNILLDFGSLRYFYRRRGEFV